MTIAAAARLRAVAEKFDARCLAEVDARLGQIVREQQVAIGLAIESGSRAWGFPSPDSDYDCRFLFVRSADDYLSPWPKRDVIETPLEDDIDLNGWELGKALKLLLKGNAVVIEWLMSPIIYDGDPEFRDELTAFAHRWSSRSGVMRHYLHLGEGQRRTYFADGKDVKLKKLFYALRPAAALRWLRLHPDRAVAPMHFMTLMEESDPPADVLAIARELIRLKSVTRELGSRPLPPEIESFIDGEFAAARAILPEHAPRLSGEAKAAAEVLFRATVARLGSTRSDSTGTMVA
jgi:predicted nucleotidyltransferase